MIGLALPGEEENLVWTSPQLEDTETLRSHPEKIFCGIGGDRLWFGPEFAYHWNGDADAVSFKNYRVPAGVDPGRYRFEEADEVSVRMAMECRLVDRRDGEAVTFQVARSVSVTDSPLPAASAIARRVRFMGVRVQHLIRIRSCPRGKSVGLWHLLQMPAGSTLIVPTRGKPRPLRYFNQGCWECRADHLRWTYTGEAKAKCGLDVHQVSGRSAVLRPISGGRWALIVRQFPVLPGLYYADAPRSSLAGEQVVQMWDGFGFGEMEYHSPAVGGQPLAREYAETALLWAFGGTKADIARVGQDLLGVVL
ncbi:MAG: hypothetical protein HYU36_20530 [Planctomycetes bacterium]|nr:hypothetical protein [Planctomycetota bacterium]